MFCNSKHLLVVIFTFLFVALHAQGPSLSITGKVLEVGSGQPMEYCTVSLFDGEESAPVTGTITDLEGKFIIEKVKPGKYTLEVSFIGFQAYRKEGIVVNPSKPKVDLGVIELAADEQAIKEVEVTSNRSTVRYEIDKKVVSVDKQISSSNGTAADVLATVPSIQVDVNGDVQLRGKSDFTVLIDGRPSVLSANEALQQIPAGNIENIEIITNPSAKYDAEGSGGIINIILKREREKGFNGIINARVGTFTNYGADAIFNYNVNKTTFTLSGGGFIRGNPSYIDRESNSLIEGVTYTTASDGNRTRSFYSPKIKLGIEHRLNDKNTFSVQGQYGGWNMLVDDELDFVLSNDQQGVTDIYTAANHTERHNKYFRLQGNYDLNMSEKSNLNINVSFNRSNFTEEVQNDLFRNGAVFDGIFSDETGPSTRFRGNIDYTYEVNDSSKFEFGFLQELGRSDEINQFSDYDAVTSTFIVNPLLGQAVVYEKNIRAFYGIFNTKYDRFGFQVGLRTEFTDRNITINEGGDRTTVRRTDLFPSMYLSYDLKNGNQLYLNYSKRIRRPRGWYLEPNPIYLDANTLWQGNPDILPIYTHSLEAGYTERIKEKGTYNVELYYSLDINNILFVTNPFTENIRIQQPINTGEFHQLGMDHNFSYTITKWWEVNVGLNIRQNFFRAEIFDLQENSSSFFYMGKVSNFFNVTKSTKVQFDGSYFSRFVGAQGFDKASYFFNLGVKQSLLKKALSLSLNYRNVFNTNRNTFSTDLPDYTDSQFYRPLYPMITVSASYRINNYRSKRPQYEDGGEF